MRVKCMRDNAGDLSVDFQLPARGVDRRRAFPLRIGNEYTVYAVTIHMGYPGFFLDDEDHLYYPRWYPSPLFEVVDRRVSRHWRYQCSSLEKREDAVVTLAFQEWAEDEGFYDRLVDGDPAATQLYACYKKLMELEFSSNVSSTMGIVIGDGWVQCPECHEAWQANLLDELTVCPSCRSIFTNPLSPSAERA